LLEEHRGYLADAPRLRAYRRAVARKVRPGSVVLDLGAGTGVLGILALRAGAARVYAVDSGPILEAARAAARAAGFADRWVGIRGLSTEVELPERADLVVADHVGCFGLDYGILEAFADARARHLRRGGDCLPETVEVQVALLSSPAAYGRVAFWDDAPAGLRFPGLRGLAANTVTFARPGRRGLLCAPATAVRVDLRRAAAGPLDGSAVLRASRDAAVHGLLGSFRSRLAPGTWITNSPLAAGAIARSPVFLPFERPLRVRRGERLAVRLRLHPARELVTWTVAGEGREPVTGSSFHGRLLAASDLRRLRPDHLPSLSPRGRAFARVLDLCREGCTVAGMREDLRRRFPRLFPTGDRAAAFLASVLDRVDG
jgi:protein arginine N-methyltransferase 1